ncbi:hypothetical protein [Citrobacter freundii]|uniref:Uncharacterized protein n=1 Tax=Citrobacter freundii TaxID=546 RepID=A0A7G2J035_CITFR|nr:hypothetical protein [Citrobacter freundii]
MKADSHATMFAPMSKTINKRIFGRFLNNENNAFIVSRQLNLS